MQDSVSGVTPLARTLAARASFTTSSYGGVRARVGRSVDLGHAKTEGGKMAVKEREAAVDTAVARSAIQKFEAFFESLDEHEQNTVSELVRNSLIYAAEHFGGADVACVPGAAEAFHIPGYVVGLTGENAPSLVRSLRFPGSLAAHSIPGCNASALVAIDVQYGATSRG